MDGNINTHNIHFSLSTQLNENKGHRKLGYIVTYEIGGELDCHMKNHIMDGSDNFAPEHRQQLPTKGCSLGAGTSCL